MNVANPNIRFTYEDYQSLPESMEKRYELLDGDIKMVPAPTTQHQFVSSNLEFIVHAFIKEQKLGYILYAPVDVVFGTGDGREAAQPDIIFVRRDRKEIIAEAEVLGPPDLIVEVLSPGTEARDRGYKMHLYGRYGVEEYWIVDPKEETLDLFRVVDESYRRVCHCCKDDRFSSSLFPGLTIELREVFHID
jgi:Uma2 family endonuclease